MHTLGLSNIFLSAQQQDERSCDGVNHMHFVQSYTLGLSSVFAQGQNASVATTEIFRGLNRYSLQDEMGDESRNGGRGGGQDLRKFEGAKSYTVSIRIPLQSLALSLPS